MSVGRRYYGTSGSGFFRAGTNEFLGVTVEFGTAYAGDTLCENMTVASEGNGSDRRNIYTPPPAAEVPALMRELVEWLRNEEAVHPVLAAGIAQFRLVHTRRAAKRLRVDLEV